MLNPSPNPWEQLYRRQPYGTLPWRQHPTDFFEKLIATGVIKKGTALDLGCGTGEKAVFLAHHGFTVTGVDIAPTAIRQAKALALKEGVKVEFLVADATNLVILKEPFDFILDCTTLPDIPEDARRDYLHEIFRLSKTGSSASGRGGSQLFLRVLSKRHPEHGTGFFHSATTRTITYTFDHRDVEEMFGASFTIRREQKTDFEIDGKKVYLDEYLLEKIK